MSLGSQDIPAAVKILSASVAGMTTTMICFPMDVAKLRMQLVGEGRAKLHRDNTYTFMRHLIRTEGIRSFYNGISASLLRQCLYMGGRSGREPNFTNKMIAGILSGSLGAILGLPADIALTRMAVDNSSPPAERRNYKNVFDALNRIVREEGIVTLTTGLKITILRAVIVNCSQLVSYTEIKQEFLKRNTLPDKLPLHIVSSAISTIIVAVLSLPSDVAKTRLQKMRIRNGVPEYNGFIDVWFKIITRESIFSLWKGITPSFFKTVPYSLILLLVYEDILLGNYKRYIMNKTD